MKIYGICENLELSVGMRLAGMHVDIIEKEEKENILKRINEIVQKNDVGVLVLSKEINEGVKEEIKEIRLKNRNPLVVIM